MMMDKMGLPDGYYWCIMNGETEEQILQKRTFDSFVGWDMCGADCGFKESEFVVVRVVK